jgi:hypothetical protein
MPLTAFIGLNQVKWPLLGGSAADGDFEGFEMIRTRFSLECRYS